MRVLASGGRMGRVGRVGKSSQSWSLAELIDFEAELAGWDGKGAGKVAGEGGRASILRAWLAGRKRAELGARRVAALNLAGAFLALLFAITGAGAAWGTLDRGSGGIHVLWFLGVTLVLPWCLLVIGLSGWLLRGRVAGGGLGAWLVERISLRLAGRNARRVIEQVRANGELAGVTGWRLARLSQWVAAAFHGGALAGLGAMVLFKRVGFYWETTTVEVMERFLEGAVRVLALPWIGFAPWALPDVAGSESTRNWQQDGLGWWPFLMLALLVWGLLPRVVLAGFAGLKERRALKNLTFQAPQHRKLWRALTEVKRGDEPTGPVDGALVVVLGGAEPDHQALRPFLLRRLRVNPTSWHSLGVLDEGREEAARGALAKAPAGVVLLAEGWSLAPRQVERALDELAARAAGRRLVLLVGNPAAGGGLGPAGAEERVEWERFMDGRRASGVELVFYEEEEP